MSKFFDILDNMLCREKSTPDLSVINEDRRWSRPSEWIPKLTHALFNKGKHLPLIPPEDRAIVDLICPKISTGPWIAGGAARSWHHNQFIQPGTDIDVFFTDEGQLSGLEKRLRPFCSVKASTDNAITLECFHRDTDPQVRTSRRGVTIQLIRCRYFKTVQELLQSFDITVCKIATDGIEFVIDDDCVADLATQTLRFSSEEAQTFKRYIKYSIYGFNLADDVDFSRMIDNIKWDAERQTDEYNDAL